MSRVLVLYGTTDGHTRKIADALGDALREAGCRVEVVEARGVPEVSPEPYDGVVVAASIHIGNYQRPVRRWVRRHAAALNARPSAFLSVCLAILEKRTEAHDDVRRIMQRFLDRSGWRPTVSKQVAGAVPYTRYNWLKKWIMKRIVTKTGGGTDTRRDYEYTDWDDLWAFGLDFARRVGGHRPAVVEG